MEKTISCKGEGEWTHFVKGHGMVVSNGEGKVEVPVSAVQSLSNAGKIKAPKGWDQDDAEAEAELATAPPATEAP